MRDKRHDILFEPIQVGPKTLKNRFVQAAHCMGAGTERPEFQAAFRGMKAEGGWACVSTEYAAISPGTDDTNLVAAKLWDDEDAASLALMVDAAHEHGALAAVELWHGGPYAKGLESRLAPIGPSQIRAINGVPSNTCREMSLADIERVQDEYVDAALRAKAAGIDIITIHSTEGAALPHLFMLPLYNLRADQYGGSFENRCRFAREVLEKVRDAVGDACAVTMRFTIDTLEEPRGLGELGIRADGEGGRVIEYLDDLVDMWDLNIGAAFAWGEDATPSRWLPEGAQEHYIAFARERTTKPIMTVGRYTNPDSMVRAINAGIFDIVGAARPSIADPFLPKKIEEGRLEDIRECIGCNYCVSRWELGSVPIACTQNATVGEEFRRGWHPERFDVAGNSDLTVLVVGAGPAGMECATVLGKRGMAGVHLVDAESSLGGSMRWTARLPGLSEWGRVIDWRSTQISKLDNVEFIPSRALTHEEVLDYGADLVVVATGSSWSRLDGTGRPIDGADQAHVLTPRQVVEETEAVPLGRILVYDLDGYHLGASISQLLAMAGREVVLVTDAESVAHYTEYTLEAPRFYRTLRDLGVEMVTSHVVDRIEVDRVVGHWVHDTPAASTREWRVDGVVLVTQRTSDDHLYRQLVGDQGALDDAGVQGVYLIGDAAGPRVIAEAIFDGHRLAREIDEKQPAVPLPYRRERPLGALRPLPPRGE